MGHETKSSENHEYVSAIYNTSIKIRFVEIIGDLFRPIVAAASMYFISKDPSKLPDRFSMMAGAMDFGRRFCYGEPFYGSQSGDMSSMKRCQSQKR